MAQTRIRYGYQRIHVVLRREGWHVNRKRVHRLYRLEGLNLRHKRPRRHKSSMQRIHRLPAERINPCWSMDFFWGDVTTRRTLIMLGISIRGRAPALKNIQ